MRLLADISIWVTVPLAEGSFAQMFDSIGKFLDNISAIQWWPLVLALVCQGAYLTIRTRAWLAGLRAAYPDEQIAWRNIWAAEVSGNGISSVVPAHAGIFVRLYLGRHSIRGSNYATVGSSCMVELPFDIFAGTLILIFGFTQGVFPELPDLSQLNAFDLSFFAEYRRFTVFFVTAVPILLLALFAYASVRVRDFWAHVHQGVTLLRSPREYLRFAALPQSIAWVFRFASLWLMLEAFNLPASSELVLTVMAVQVAASMIPLTPQGAGVQQALLYAALAGVATGPAIAAYSVGQQLVVAVFNAAFGLVALAFVFRTTDWRSLMRAGRAEKEAEGAGGSATALQDAPTAEHPTLEYPAELPDAPRDY